MNYLEENDYNTDLHGIIQALQFKKHKISLKGSSSLKYMMYTSDYDLFSKIRDYKRYTIYDTISHIMENTQQIDDLWHIETKIQYTNGEKIKPDVLSAELFKNVEFIKLDFVVRIYNKFKELSIIYQIHESAISYHESLKNDISELIDEGNYYKVLKRYFNLHKTNKSTVNKLSKFFNSEYGQIYENVSQLKAITLLQEHYDDTFTYRKIKISLKDMHVVNIDEYIDVNEKILNSVAKKIYNCII